MQRSALASALTDAKSLRSRNQTWVTWNALCHASLVMFHKTENNVNAIIFSGTFKNFTLRQLRLVVFVVLFFVVLNKGGSCLTSFSHSTPLPPHHLSPSPGWITSRTSRYPGTSFQTPPVLSALWNYPFQVFVAFKTAYFIFKSVHLLLNSPVTVSGKGSFLSLFRFTKWRILFVLSPASWVHSVHGIRSGVPRGQWFYWE